MTFKVSSYCSMVRLEEKLRSFVFDQRCFLWLLVSDFEFFNLDQKKRPN